MNNNIEFFALGGLDEREKQCYVLGINDEYLIINSGTVIPPSTTLGVKKMIPDFTWVSKNANKIKGILIPNPRYTNYASLEFLYRYLRNVPIITSEIGYSIIWNHYQKRSDLKIDFNFVVAQPFRWMNLGHINFSAFKVCSSIPFTYGFCFNSPLGNIVYIDNFVISNSFNLAFEDQIIDLPYITKRNVALLITGVGIVGKNPGFTTPAFRNIDFYENVISDHKKRIIIGCYDEDVYTVLAIAMLASKMQRPFIVYSNTFEKVFKHILKLKLIPGINLNILPDNKINESENAIVIVTGTPQRLFAKLNKIIAEEDKKISLKQDDLFIFSSQTIVGYEKYQAELMDNVTRYGIKALKLPNKFLPLKASNEDHKLLVRILRPKYILPVGGIYKEFVDYKNTMKQLKIDPKTIFNLRNGDKLIINNKFIPKIESYLDLTDQYVSSENILDVGSTSLFERDQMGENGAIIVSLAINFKKRTLLRYNIDLVGVLNFENNMDAIEECNAKIIESIEETLKKADNNFLSKEFKNYIKKITNKVYEKKFNKKSLVISTIITTNR